MTKHNESTPHSGGPNQATNIQWGTTMLGCPSCGSKNVADIDAEIFPWTHEDGRPGRDIGMLFRCHQCDITFRLVLYSRGLLDGDGAHILVEYWASDGMWS